MRVNRSVVAGLAAGALLLAGCGEPAEDAGTSGGGETATPAQIDAESVAFGSALAQIRGHHLVSLELYRAGDVDGALAHAGHPIEEILASVQSELEEHDPGLGDRLESNLQAGAGAVREEQAPRAVAAAYEDAAGTTRDALTAVVGEAAGTPAHQGSVIASLLSTAAHEYEEAVGSDRIRLLVEYQDAYAFAAEARDLYRGVSSDVESAAPEEAEEIEEAFATLSELLPSPRPPAEVADPLEVTSAAELIGHELEETVDAEVTEQREPEQVVAEIEELLDEAVSAYRRGDEGAAAELAAEAYLENYEVIEAEVIEQAPAVNDELEPLLGAELRRQMGEGAPVREIEGMVERARSLLAEALAALEEGGH